jgi:hypothetical protein
MLTARTVAKERGLTSGYRVVINNGEQVSILQNLGRKFCPKIPAQTVP